ncbi:MAG: DUF72 domain-containing protein [Bryobacteraceae bacterium]
MGTLPLFDEPPSFDRDRLKAKLNELASAGVFIGASSWKYEGWMGQIYTPDRYYSRGKFSQKRFEQECLAEYAETFPIVCGDFSFYQFPAQEYWNKLFSSAPRGLRYALKVPEEITVKSFPKHARYGPRAGGDNPAFLDAAIFHAMFLDLLRPWREQIAVLVFEFTAFPKYSYRDAAQFVRELDPFLAALPSDFRYAVEIRNEEFLTPEYFACLRSHGVAHVLNAWTRMPELQDQIVMPEIFTSDFTVIRALLRRGRPYEQAIAQFSPYKETQDLNPGARGAMRTVISRARERNEPSYIFVNNRLEGNAPRTIESLVD